MTTTLELKFSSNSEVFKDSPGETSRILRELADNLDDCPRYSAGNLVNINGRIVGSYHFANDDEL